jgi:F0F1-type ATP synthase membrane subunit c/vacuolar-type H+-ATPase subunit K
MISSLIGLIGSTPWGISALLYVAAGLLVTSLGLGVEVKIQAAHLDAAKARQESLGDKIATQNRAISTWKSAAEIQAHRAVEASQRAEKVRVVTTERIRTITLLPVPVACPEAVQWGADQAIKFNKHWEGQNEE